MTGWFRASQTAPASDAAAMMTVRSRIKMGSRRRAMEPAPLGLDSTNSLLFVSMMRSTSISTCSISPSECDGFGLPGMTRSTVSSLAVRYVMLVLNVFPALNSSMPSGNSSRSVWSIILAMEGPSSLSVEFCSGSDSTSSTIASSAAFPATLLLANAPPPASSSSSSSSGTYVPCMAAHCPPVPLMATRRRAVYFHPLDCRNACNCLAPRHAATRDAHTHAAAAVAAEAARRGGDAEAGDALPGTESKYGSPC
mmetsp:Transcript_24641/g.63996  ORF Transcript_24641/g.63996 Transcript_24641/m.63996 type:complete len:253 (-) Transcript_24641:83-841(-)